MVLAQKVAVLPGYSDTSKRRAPMLAERLREFAFDVKAVAALTRGAFNCQAATRTERIGHTTDDRLGNSGVGRETERAAIGDQNLTGVTAVEHPFANLSLEFDHV